jgi:hypothetical protein
MSQFNSSFTINNPPNQQFYAKNYTSNYLKFNKPKDLSFSNYTISPSNI